MNVCQYYVAEDQILCGRDKDSLFYVTLFIKTKQASCWKQVL